ncbi:MAG TPA: disulfide bond formation protein B [Usitatibacter sp.]|nr:disulfide bond formation protein B [Usitatibacter sp.]
MASPRVVFGAIFAIAAGMILFAIYYLQDYVGLEPCPMCILSRYCFIAIAAVALVATLHGPRGTALKAYAVLVSLLAFAGIGVSVRHSWLQHFPPKVESCGADLEFLLNTLPLSKSLPKIFSGTGSCAKVDWKLLGLSIPEWALVWFAVFALAAIWVAFVRPRKTRA